MGKVLVIYNIKPESPDTDIEAVQEEVKKVEFFDKLEVKPFMFGMSLISASFIIPDQTEGGTDSVEEKLKGVPGVQSIEQAAFTLV